MTIDTTPGLLKAASVARSRAKLIASTTRGGSAAAIALHDIATEYERMARRAQTSAPQPEPLTSPAAAPAPAAE